MCTPFSSMTRNFRALNSIVDRLGGTKSEAIRQAIRNSAEELKGMEVVKIRDVTKAQARKEILEYLDKRERAWSSEIADGLRLDLALVNDALQELWSERKVEPTT